MKRNNFEIENNTITVKNRLLKAKMEALNRVGLFLKERIKETAPRSKKSNELAAKRGYGPLHDEVVYWINKKKELKLYVTKKGFYGRFVEFGTKKMQAKPFINPIIQQNEQNIKKIIAESILYHFLYIIAELERVTLVLDVYNYLLKISRKKHL